MASVLIAVDGSGHADKAFASGLAVDETEWMTMLAERIKKEDDLIARYTNPLKEKQIEHEVIREEGGEPGHKLCHVAEKKNANFIVTGTRGLGKIRRTVMGSVSDYILHHAHCPVIVCRY